jgi:non-ribosomal peptide synthetase component F
MVQTVEPADPVRVNSYMKQALEGLVVALESTPNREVLEIEVLPPEERKLLLQGLNTFTADYPRHKTIHQLFEEQVQQTPQATALVFMDQSLTYLQLNEHANQLACRLIQLGVQPDTLVAICVDRSIAMITGILGILKAGGAYVPLDPAYASGRLRDILEDATPAVVLVDESGRNALSEELLSGMTVLDPNTLLNIEDSKR